GAIDAVRVENGRLVPHVIGDGEPRGICGSGLVDAAARALDAGLLLPNGRLKENPLPLAPGIEITQSDIRQLQLAKGAMAAGLKILARDAVRLRLAGAFGNYLHPGSAKRIGLLPEDVAVEPAGNAALRGARMLLLEPLSRQQRIRRIVSMTEHVELAADPSFQDLFAESMRLEPYRLR
ncbi:MAG: ASKHA domain-containing protein, partial [Bryobacteraceae bacterium]